MRLFQFFVVISLCVVLSAVSAAFSQTSRAELERKYPDIKFHWMKEAPAGQPLAGEMKEAPAEQPIAGEMKEAPAGQPIASEMKEVPAEQPLAGEAKGADQAGEPPAEQPLWPGDPATAESLAREEMEQRMMRGPEMRIEEMESATATNLMERESYVLGPGDVMSLNVRDHPEFSSPALAVGLGGELILPLTNEVIYAEDLTAQELAGKIQQRLEAYIEMPFVTVFIIEYNSKKYYILGEIGAGVYPIGDTSITLMDALYQAGLPYEGTSAMRRVQIITPDEEAPKNEWINVYAILYKGRMKHNITIQPGTIIYVPSTMLTKLSGVVRQLSTTTEDLASVPWDLANFDAGLIAFDRAYGHGGYVGKGLAWHSGW